MMSLGLILGVGILLNAVCVVGGGEVYTSVAKLKLLPEIERKLIEACDKYLNARDSPPGLDNLKSFLSSARGENEHALDDPAYLENPVNGFRFLWRLVDGWQRATRVRCGTDCDRINRRAKNFLQQVRSSIDSVSSWPTHEDISGLAVSITNLMHIYDLDPEDFAKGRLLHTKTAPFDGEELLVIADEVYHHHSLQDAQIWLNRSIARLEEMRDQEQLLREAHYKLRHIEAKFDARKRDGLPTKTDVFYQLDEGEEEEPQEETQDDRGVKQRSNKVRGFYQSVYEDLCRGDIKTPAEKASLHCWYKGTIIPYLKVKVEQLNEDPAIFIYHDVISDSEMEQVKNISMSLLKRSLLGKSDGSGHEKLKERTSQSAWIFDDTDVTPQLSRRVQLMTGLSTKLQRTYSHAEAFQILNYGLGGMYEPHEDSVRMYRKLGYETSPAVRDSGDRMATWLFYMSDVTAGGATVFPLLKTRVPVVKGSAAFWYNLKQNGQADQTTIHAGCPVLIGDKWVANKWIREIGQTFRRPCSLNPDK